MGQPLYPGDVLYGFCGGYFGRDSYEDKVIAARGADWCVAREVFSGRPVFACVEGDLLIDSVLSEHTINPQEDDG